MKAQTGIRFSEKAEHLNGNSDQGLFMSLLRMECAIPYYCDFFLTARKRKMQKIQT